MPTRPSSPRRRPGWGSGSSASALPAPDNGKVERFNKTLLAEWAYARLDRGNTERRRALTGWLQFYNRRRPHTALDGLTPMTVLINNARGNHRWAAREGCRRAVRLICAGWVPLTGVCVGSVPLV
jgi:hypothetical protein